MLSGIVVPVRSLIERWDKSKSRVHQIVQDKNLEKESPCSRCGGQAVLVRESDVRAIEKADAEKAKAKSVAEGNAARAKAKAKADAVKAKKKADAAKAKAKADAMKAKTKADAAKVKAKKKKAPAGSGPVK